MADFLFYLFAALTVGSALSVALNRNAVNAALSLFLTFFGMAGLFVLLEAYFLAVLQIMVYGGAVVVLLPHTDPIGALDVAERIRTEVLAQRLDWHGVAISATVSVGVAAIGSGHASLDALLREAEQALDAAKAAGRNCVRAAPIRPRRSGEARPVISK